MRPHHALAALLTLVVAAGPAAAADEAQTVEQVLECVQANLPDSTSVQLMEFESKDRDGGGRELLAKIYWKRFDGNLSKVLVRMLEPDDVRDSGLLMIEKEARTDMFLYLPELKKSRRVTSHMMNGSLFGTDFSYEDFQRLQGMRSEVRSELREGSKLDGTPVHVMVQYPEPAAESAYERVVSYIDQDTCVLLKSEMYEPGDRLRKVITTDRNNVIEQGGARVPREVVIQDVKKETSTRLAIKDIEVGNKISRKMFSQSILERPRSN